MPQPDKDGPIVVIGSINMDLVCRVPHRPAPGETVLGSEFTAIPGGKGANQAVAAARLGGEVHMIGRVGDDDMGRELIAGLVENNIGIERVLVTANTPSGVAMILVDEMGQNSIVVAPGANGRLTKQDINASRELIESAAVVVVQLEIPLSVVRYALDMCRKAGVFTIVDPAPAVAELPEDLFDVDIVTPNESEAQILLGNRGEKLAPKDIASGLLEHGARTAVLKRGARGAVWFDQTGRSHSLRAFKINVVDTTAAGDAFTGALAVAVAEGMDPLDSLRFASAAGAMCCQGFGAQPSLPKRKQVDKFLRQAR